MADSKTQVSMTNTTNSMLKGADAYLSAKTVVGDPIQVGDVTVIPLVDVTFGMGAGAMNKAKGGDSAAGGIGGKLAPTAVMVIKNGYVQVVPVHDDSALASVLNKIPGLIDKVTDVIKLKMGDESGLDDKKSVDEIIDGLEDEPIK